MKPAIPQANIESLLDFFDRILPLDKEEKDLIQAKFSPRLFRKRQYVLQEGNICTHFYFVVRGCLRMYKIDNQGAIHILQFAVENSWINDLGSFHGLSPSALNIDAVEDTVVLQISREDLVTVYLQAPKFNRIFRVLLENGFVRLQERLLQNISSTAGERYQSFLEVYPHLVNRLSQVQIASFLGITPEFLSRMRNKQSRTTKTKSGTPKPKS
jgi:CRP/FNR family transcriptional regulator, anaerobic regulatory protein